jgi:hypothetical protein
MRSEIAQMVRAYANAHQVPATLSLHETLDTVPRTAGLYILFAGTVVDYIGTSCSLGQRIRQNTHYRRGWHTIGVITYPAKSILRHFFERELITRFVPRLNIDWVNGRKSNPRRKHPKPRRVA